MKKVLSIFVFALVFAVALVCQTLAQDQNRGFIRWRDDQPCGVQRAQKLDKEEGVLCDSFVSNGATVKIIKDGNLFIAANFSEQDGYLILDVYVSNDSENRILIDPQRWATIYAKSLSAKDLAEDKIDEQYAIDPSRIAGKIMSRMRWANFFIALGAAMPVTTTDTTTGTVRTIDQRGNVTNGTYTGQATVTGTDPVAERTAAIQNAGRYDQAMSKADNILSTALLPNTVFPKQKLTGLVYFKKKKAGYADVILGVGDRNYVFCVIGCPKT